MSIPQSLPSFAQAFSSSSLSDANISNALPPIQQRPTHSPPASATKKRQRQDNNIDSDATVRIKEEDRDDAQRPPQSPPQQPSRDSSATPSSKKRRVTVSGTPVVDPIPISPVDDAREQQRQNLVKQLQKQPLDQRTPPADQLTSSKLARIGRVSPTTIPLVSRCAGNPTSPPQQPPPTEHSKQPQPAATHSLPPPPISFARRRAAQSGGRKKKPADIVISPRGAGPSDPLAPVIQSAPPVADPARFQMAIPRLPLMNNAQTTRRVAGNVPPTPTRFSLQGTTAPVIPPTARPIQSPPNLSVPIANALVPPTPHALQHPGYSGDKSAFLAPFGVFYDALNDSKQLKSWLSDQLQKSNGLMMSLKQQQEKMDEIVEDLVEKRTRAMREEITLLRQRMESLEEALLAVRADSSADPPGYGYPQGAKLHPNGGPEPSSYRFPAPEQRRPDPTVREQEHRPSVSPPVEVARRPSVSATGARAEPLLSTFTLGGHCRRASGPQGGAVKAVRPVPERSSTARPTDSRTVSRTYYSGTYGNGVEGRAPSREGNKS